MTEYEKRMQKSKLMREMKLGVYLDIVSKAFEKDDYEDMDPMSKINLMTVVVNHSRLSNRIEG